MKPTIFSTLAIIAVTLTACSSLSASTLVSSIQVTDTSPTELQLAIGIFKLEGTENEVTATQAPELLLLWQVYQELIQSDTVAQAEFDALVAQVQETMTAEQIQAIKEMQISQQDVTLAMQGFGATTASSSNGSNITVPNGGMQAGGPPDMGGSMPADFGGSGGPITSSSQAQNAQTGSGVESSAGVLSAVIEALIQILE